MICGASYIAMKQEPAEEGANPTFAGLSSGGDTVTVYSTYLGPVQLPRSILARDGSSYVFKTTLSNGKAVHLVDAVASGLDMNNSYSLQQLSTLPAATLTMEDNQSAYACILKLREIYAISNGQTKEARQVRTFIDSLGDVPVSETYLRKTFRDQRLYQHVKEVLAGRASASRLTPKCYHQALITNSSVDILFNIIHTAEFFRDELKYELENPMHLAVVNVPDLDNAFWTGEYSVCGNGKDYFFVLCAQDVQSHENGHGIVQRLAGLEYKSESGGLNEGFADIIGAAVERYIYQKLNGNNSKEDDILGYDDNVIGEDSGKKVDFLRNLEHPSKADIPQPEYYRGSDWPNTSDTSAANDYGSVHIVSSILNKLFIRCTKAFGYMDTVRDFFAVLKRLQPTSDYRDFTIKLVDELGPENENKLSECLRTVGLHVFLTHTPQPQQPLNTGLCCPHCPSRGQRPRNQQPQHVPQQRPGPTRRVPTRKLPRSRPY